MHPRSCNYRAGHYMALCGCMFKSSNLGRIQGQLLSFINMASTGPPKAQNAYERCLSDGNFRYALRINIFAIKYCFCFNVTAANMNWVSVVIFITTAYMVLAWYLWQRHVFTGPRLNTRFIQNSRSRAASLPHKHSPCGLIDQPSNETIDKDAKVD
ncbi:hypothetical protein ALUC_80234A [Aspergillus luchuensis]|nr:hypothetical protein ALUC_80234A [Aspergillus luchuensis]